MAANISQVDWQLKYCQIRVRTAYLLDTGLWADCTFLVGDSAKQMKAHKMLLAMASPVFEAMFYGALAEGDAPISIPDIEPHIFHSLLKYIYTDLVDMGSYTNACALYYSAQKYMIPHLQAACVEFLSDNLTTHCVGRVYEFASMVGETGLVMECVKMMQKETKAILASGDFERLLPDTLLQIFSLDQLNIDSELDLFRAAVHYVFGKKIAPKTRPEATFRYTFHNIRSLDVGQTTYSPRFYVSDLPWRMYVRRKDTVHLTLGLECVRDRVLQSRCVAKGELGLVCHGKIKPSQQLKYSLSFHSADDSWACKTRIKWHKLLDPSRGYLQENAITLEAHVVAKIPGAKTDSDTARQESPKLVLNKPIQPPSSKESKRSNPPVADRRRSSRLNRDQFNKSVDSVRGELDPSKKALARKLIKKIRFLTFTPQELVKLSSLKYLLSDKELLAILMNVTANNTNEPMPQGFSTSRRKRTNKIITIANNQNKDHLNKVNK